MDQSLRVGIDSLSCSYLAYESLKVSSTKNENRIKELSGVKAPVSKLKIIKNETEVRGLREALARESASLLSVYAQIRD